MIAGMAADEVAVNAALADDPIALTLTPSGKLIPAGPAGETLAFETAGGRFDPRSMAGQLDRQLGGDGVKRVTTAIVLHPLIHEICSRVAALRASRGQKALSDAGVKRTYSASELYREAVNKALAGYVDELRAAGSDVITEWQTSHPGADLEPVIRIVRGE